MEDSNNNNTNNKQNNIEIDFEELDSKIEDLLYAIKDFTFNTQFSIKQNKNDNKTAKKVKKLDVDKIRKAIIDATEIAKKGSKKK